jgi:hypothetical protein
MRVPGRDPGINPGILAGTEDAASVVASIACAGGDGRVKPGHDVCEAVWRRSARRPPGGVTF